MTRKHAIPVITYHSVGRPIPGWRWSDLTTPWRCFEDHLQALSKRGYRSASLTELHAHVSGQSMLPDRTVVLTFDDGYADNWAYVVPLLERYGMQGTVLVTPEFVDPGESVRPTFEQSGEGEAFVAGFMNWAEIREAYARGTLIPQSHGLTHTWYPVSDRVVDFHHPGDGVYWLDWNDRPEEKPGYLANPTDTRVPWGTPLYEHAKSLECTRFFPEPGEARAVVDYVRENGGESFFLRSDWREALFSRLAEHREGKAGRGHYEGDDERTARFAHELDESRRQIESRTGAEVHHLVWPGGGCHPDAEALARARFLSAPVSSRRRWSLWNEPGDDPFALSRRGVPSVEARGRVVWPGGSYLVDFIEEFRGSAGARRRRQVRKLLALARISMGGGDSLE